MSAPAVQTQVVLRPAEARDRPAVAAMFAEHLTVLGYAPDLELDRDMGDVVVSYSAPGDGFLVALEGEHYVGMGGRRAGEIRRLYVRPSHRRRGLARMILGALIPRNDRAPGRRIFAIVSRSNRAARATFVAAGFKGTDQSPDHPAMRHCEVFEHIVEEREC